MPNTDTTPLAVPDRAAVPSVAQLAKATLRRLALEKLEPTPENYARAYALERGGARAPCLPEPALTAMRRLAERALGAESGARAQHVVEALSDGQWERALALLNQPDESAAQWAGLIDRLVRSLERGGRVWTLARKKEGLQRVLAGSRSDAHRLRQRLGQLLGSWEGDVAGGEIDAEALAEVQPAVMAASLPASPLAAATLAEPNLPQAGVVEPVAGTEAAAAAWPEVVERLCTALAAALPSGDAETARLPKALSDAAAALIAQQGSAAAATELTQVCEAVRRALQHRHHLVDQLGNLCHELTASMVDLAESGSWARGQCEAMNQTLGDGISARAVKAVSVLLGDTRKRQVVLRSEREQAREALKTLIGSMLGELNELGSQTGRFHDNVGRLTGVIEQADTLDGLTLVVREMVEESRAVHTLVAQSQVRLNEEHAKATGLSERVNQLENELQRLSEEVTTDQLTKVANRRGLLKVFEVERARMERSGNPLAIGLLDIDNFKRLNDEHGHQTGDEALKALAALTSKTLRATDLVARYGGEEFVVLLPETNVQEAQATLTRLQRALSGGLFLNERKEMLVTFSAGVTECRAGEGIETVLERADQALYEAKRTGKNRTCAA